MTRYWIYTDPAGNAAYSTVEPEEHIGFLEAADEQEIASVCEALNELSAGYIRRLNEPIETNPVKARVRNILGK